jgi:hypothetical protein
MEASQIHVLGRATGRLSKQRQIDFLLTMDSIEPSYLSRPWTIGGNPRFLHGMPQAQEPLSRAGLTAKEASGRVGSACRNPR